MSLFLWRRDPAQGSFFVFRSDLDRLFDELWQGSFRRARSFAPRIAVRETDSQVQVEAELPGLTEQDFELVLEGALLTLRVEKHGVRDGEKAEACPLERAHGRFDRTIELPCEVDPGGASARYKQGLLRVTLPKLDAKQRGEREIAVRTP
jgi:HSP20 family protein